MSSATGTRQSALLMAAHCVLHLVAVATSFGRRQHHPRASPSRSARRRWSSSRPGRPCRSRSRPRVLCCSAVRSCGAARSCGSARQACTCCSAAALGRMRQTAARACDAACLSAAGCDGSQASATSTGRRTPNTWCVAIKDGARVRWVVKFELRGRIQRLEDHLALGANEADPSSESRSNEGAKTVAALTRRRVQRME